MCNALFDSARGSIRIFEWTRIPQFTTKFFSVDKNVLQVWLALSYHGNNRHKIECLECLGKNGYKSKWFIKRAADNDKQNG